MSFPNGKIPSWALAPMPGMAGAYLTPACAASWGALRNAVYQQYGWYPTATSVADAYRSYEIQERIFLQRYTRTYHSDINAVPMRTKRWNGVTWYLRKGMATAAVPGKSNHGDGVAVDVTGLGSYGSVRFGQFARVATAHGWSNAEGQTIDEYWHWTKISARLTGNETPGTGTVVDIPDINPIDPIEPEDDMAYTPEQLEAIVARALANNLDRLLGESIELDKKAFQTLERIASNRGSAEYRMADEVSAHFIAKNLGSLAPPEHQARVTRRQDLHMVLAEAGVQAGDVVDEAALAAALAPLLTERVQALSDADLLAIAEASADEADRRERERLGKTL